MEREKDWISSYSLYMACKEHFGNREWLSWKKDIRERLHAYANEKGIQIIGDIPIYVALDSFVSMAMATGNLQDVMLVRSHEELEELVKKDLIADLSEVYENCASKTIKEIYQSYDKSLLSGVRFEGKLMALPETNIDDGPNLFWVRKDWMDKLGLQEPRTMQDIRTKVPMRLQNIINGMSIRRHALWLSM